MKLKAGQKVAGIVKGIQPYGVFVKLQENQQGLIHISECQTGYVGDLKKIFRVGQEVETLIIDIDEYSKQISLSIRALHDHSTNVNVRPKRFWTNKKYHTGFKPLDAEINGFVHEALKKYKNA